MWTRYQIRSGELCVSSDSLLLHGISSAHHVTSTLVFVFLWHARVDNGMSQGVSYTGVSVGLLGANGHRLISHRKRWYRKPRTYTTIAIYSIRLRLTCLSPYSVFYLTSYTKPRASSHLAAATSACEDAAALASMRSVAV